MFSPVLTEDTTPASVNAAMPQPEDQEEVRVSVLVRVAY